MSSKNMSWRVWTAMGLAIPLSAVHAQTSWTVRQPGFVLEPLVQSTGGLQLPVAIGLVRSPGAQPSSPLLYVAERYGTIKLVRRDGSISTYASGLTNLGPGPIPGAGELGIGGLVVDPATGDLLVAVAYDAAPPAGTIQCRIVRLTSTDGGLTSNAQSVLLELPEPVSGNAQALGVSIGPDGRVYALIGDGGDPPSAQNPESFRGKVLRLNSDGSAPSDNPLYNTADGITASDYVFASGLRRPAAGAWRGLDLAMYVVDQGPVVTDRLAKLTRGRNYLFDGTDASLVNYAMYNWAPAAAPAPQIAAAPASAAFVQSETFGGSGFPATSFGRLYVAETGPAWTLGTATMGKRLSQVYIDGAGISAAPPVTVVEYTGTGRATCGAVAAGPDGVYFSELYRDQGATAATDAGAAVWRVRYVGTAAFTATPTFVDSTPVSVQFADASVVPGASSWLWSFGDGATSVQRNPQHVYAANGSYTVRLTVTGSAGTVVSERRDLIRVGQPPRIALIRDAAATGQTLQADDNAIAYLQAQGWQVVAMDDEPANRPGSGQISQEYQLAVISSSVTSGNIGGEFTSSTVPLVFWESSLLRTTREALASNGVTASAQTQIEIVDRSHWITRNLNLGPVTMFSSGQTISLASDTLAPSARVLATRVGQPTLPAIMTAEAQTPLLNNYVAPARRVFLFYENSAFTPANTAARTILSDSACWAMRLSPEFFTQPQGGPVVVGQTLTLSATTGGGRPRVYRWKKDGAQLSDDARIAGSGTEILTIHGVQASDAGNYTLELSVPCGTAVSQTASITVTQQCVADFDSSGQVSVQDIFDYLSAYFSNNPRADINGGGITVQDIFDFLSLYFAGCP